MKKIIIIVALFVLGIFLFTGQYIQDEWRAGNPDPRMRRLSPLKNYVRQPDYAGTDNYVNPNKTTRYIQSPAGAMSVSPNFRIHPTPAPGAQSEVIIYSSLLNPNLIFASANVDWISGAGFTMGGYVSTNGGLNWYGRDTVSPLNYADPGPVIDKNNTYIISFVAVSGQIGVSRSTNFGLSWLPAVLVPGSTDASDKNLSGTNYASASPYYGHSYIVYSEFDGVNLDRIVFSRTTNSGVSWSAEIPISPSPSLYHFHQGADVTAGPEGNIYSVWANSNYVAPYTEDSLGFAKSTDGGITWTARNNAADMNGIRSDPYGPWPLGINGFPRLDVDRSGGSRNGWIYVVAPEKNFPGGDVSDIYLWRSTNQGATFSAPIRVNQDAANGKLQFHSAINVDTRGGVNVVYYDCRNSNANDSTEIYVSRSLDGGITWTDIKVSDAKIRPGTGGFFGDYIGITSTVSRIIPNWADNRTGRYQSWAAFIDIAPALNHTPLANTEQTTGNRIVNAMIIPSGSGINPNFTKLYYAKNNTSFSNAPLTYSGGQNWTANLPLSGAGVYNYYLSATDSLSRTGTAPEGAPASYYSFTAAVDTVRPVIVTIPLVFAPKSEWPLVVTAIVTDNIGVDSVWVRWYKNNTGSGVKQFRLLNAGGSNYAAAFNSDSTQVSYNDSIFYRVFARDNSTNHNTDSTAQYKIRIVNTKTACIGTGTTSLDYPFSALYSDARTDMLYTSAEINAAGGVPGYITKLGFDVISASSQVMNGFRVKIQNTSGTTVSGFTSAGWTLCYDGAYTVPGTGVRYINLTTPFYYNGTSNLLVEICYNSAGYSVNSYVKGTQASGRVVHQHANLAGDGCTDLTSPSTLLMLPNICFNIALAPIGIGNIGSEIPSVYSLSQNYPNPFNPVTKINFSIPKQGLVTLKIYDILGREVRTLVNEVKTPGNYSVDFNGNELSGGVYFYRLQSADFTDVKKLVLLK